MKYYVYKITNKINGKIYIGCHQTENIDDGYMGSGILLTRAQKKYGIENFEKEILEFFDNKEDMFNMEAKLVNEDFLLRENVYNLTTGGHGGRNSGSVDTVTVKDKDGNTMRVSVNDPRYLSGELVGITKGKVLVKGKDKNIYVDVDDPRYLSGELKHVAKGLLTVKDKHGNIFSVNNNDPRYLSGKLVNINKGKINVKDKLGNYFQIDKNDSRYLSGELVGITKGRHLSEEHKRKISEANKIKLKGKGNSQYGTCWIFNEELKENKKIKRETLDNWIKRGWERGRKIDFK